MNDMGTPLKVFEMQQGTTLKAYSYARQASREFDNVVVHKLPKRGGIIVWKDHHLWCDGKSKVPFADGRRKLGSSTEIDQRRENAMRPKCHDLDDRVPPITPWG